MPRSVLPVATPRRRRVALIAVVALLFAALAGCASFPDVGPRNWHDKPDNNGPAVPRPNAPGQGPDTGQPDQPPPPQQGQPATPDGCTDPDPQVVATCLNPVSAVAVLPDGQSALVAERDTGQVLMVQKGKPAQPFSTIPVDGAAGGVMGLVLSPTFEDDQLVYAYAATGTDNRVLRIAKGYPPVPILTGIPHAANAGSLAVGKGGALLVATGSPGADPGPGSLAGKVLRIDTFGHPLKDNPKPGSPVYSSGLRAPAGMCVTPGSGAVWVTDRLPDHDVLYQATPGQLTDPAWSWPDLPGVAGCVAPPGAVAVAEQGASALFMLRTSPQGGFTGTPQTLLPGTYGRLDPAVLAPDGLIWLGTTNKGQGGPVVSSDDRVIRIKPPSGGSGSGPD